MKAERRHELKTNELAKGLERLPELGKRYGGVALLAVVVIALAIVLIRHRINSQRQAQLVAEQNLASAYYLVDALRNPDLMRISGAEQLAIERRQEVDAARQAILAVLQGTEDKSVLASALVAQGDLNWLIANLPAIPAATTQPSLQLDITPADATEQARNSYQEVLKSYPDRMLPVMAARFGLAGIAENEGQWEAARRAYEAVQQDERAPVALKTLASMRLTLLNTIQQPLYLADVRPVPASTAPATTAPATTAPMVLAPATTAPMVLAPATTAPSTQP